MRSYGILALVLLPASALADPSLSLSFGVDEIDAGLDTSLTASLDIDGPTQGLAFTIELPLALAAAAPANLSSDCDGDLALAGDTLTVAIDRISESCEITMWVTAIGAPGVVAETASSQLTWSGGSAAAATAQLSMVEPRGSLDAYFEPSSVSLGETARLHYTIGWLSGFQSVALNHALPDSAVLGSHVSNCDALTVSENNVYMSKFFSSGGECSGWIEVTPAETLRTLAGPLTASPSTDQLGEKAVELTVHSGPVRAVVTNDPVVSGAEALLEITLLNRDRSREATDITWSVDLDTALSGLKASSLPTEPCGAGSALSGASEVSLSGGNIPAEGECSFVIPVTVPNGLGAALAAGTTASASLKLDGEDSEWAGAPWVLRVSPSVRLTANVTNSPLVPGATALVDYTLTNLGADPVTALAFSQVLNEIQSATLLPNAGACGPASTFVTEEPSTNVPFTLSMQGMSLAPAGNSGDSCTVRAELDIPTALTGGRYDIPTSAVDGSSSDVDFQVPGAPVFYEILAAPSLGLSVRESAVAPGGTATLDFELHASENFPSSATSMGFTLDLEGALSGLAALNLPQSDVCGSGSQLTFGSGVLQLQGAELEPESRCSFTVETEVPSSSAGGTYTLATSAVQATVAGASTTSSSAAATLQVGDRPAIEISFGAPSVTPQGEIDITYVVRNLDSKAYDVVVKDTITDPFEGAAFLEAPSADWCNSGSSSVLQSNNTKLLLTAQLDPGDECTATARFTAGTTLGELSHTASLDYAGQITTGSASLVVQTGLSGSLEVSPALAGQTIPAEFTLSAPVDGVDVTGVGFTLDLEGALAGLVAEGLPKIDVCGQGSILEGKELVRLNGGMITGGESCTFTLDLVVPDTVLGPDSFDIRTSELTFAGGTIDALSGHLDLRVCRDGYGATSQPGFCDDVDECASGEHTCDVNAECSNAEGGFSCECLDGFTGDGATCTDVDECADDTHDCGDRSTCANAVGSFVCECPEGTEGDECTEVCGDGLVVFDEECDDENLDAGDGCDAVCAVEAGFVCVGEPSECEETCGNSVLDEGETCDDGNLTNSDGCSDICAAEAGYVCTGEPSVCNATCGDGTLDEGETCDDGNLSNDDGCSDTCAVEDGYVCSGEPSFCEIDCDADPAACSGTCGDGEVNGREECDDGIDNSDDAQCTPDCRWNDDDDTGGDTEDPEGCGCSTQGGGSFLALLLPLAFLRRRRNA